MAGIEFNNWETTRNPAWHGDFSGREHNLAGGAFVDPDEFSAGEDGKKYIPSGTLLGRTYTERDAGTGFGPAQPEEGEGGDPPADDEFYLLMFDVTDALVNAECELYRHGSLVKENFLPEATQEDADTLAKVRDLYECTIGAE